MGLSGLLRWARGRFGISLLLALSASGGRSGAEALDAAKIIQGFLETAKASAEREAAQELIYVRRSVFEHLNGDGTVEERRSKEHWVTNSAGSVRAELIRVNDREPTAGEILSDQKHESEGRRKLSRRSRGPDFLDARLLSRFDYTWEAVEELAGREVYRLAFEPVQTNPDSNNSTGSDNRDVNRVIGLLHGHLWIDIETFELVRMECSLRSPFRLLGGLVGSLSRLDLVVDRRPVAAGCWSNVNVLTHIEGRKLISPLRIRASIEQEGFKLRPIDSSPATH